MLRIILAWGAGLIFLLVFVGNANTDHKLIDPGQEISGPDMANNFGYAQNCAAIKLSKMSDGLTKIVYRLNGFNKIPVHIDNRNYFRITLGNEGNIMERGVPDLPVICRSIMIPNYAELEMRVVANEYNDYKLPVAPSKGHILRGNNPDDVSYEFSEIYRRNEFWPQKAAQLGRPYIFRDVRGVTISLYPFAYNPGTRILRIYSEIILELHEKAGDETTVSTRDTAGYDAYFADIYRSHFLNFSNPNRELLGEHGRMIVISNADFMAAIQPYVDWKNQKGIPTEIYDVASVGMTAEAIKTFIQSEYNSDDGLTFVQLVGDAEHVPTFLIARDFCDGMATSDASYALLEGDDSYPEIFVGRFSAANADDVVTQVERTLFYERDIEEGEWLHKASGMGSAWGETYGYLGLRDRDLVEMLRLMLLEYNYTEMDQLYEWGEPPFDIIPVPVADFVNAINDGRGLVIVEGHADCESSFMIPPGTFGDLFTVDSIYNLTNEFMLPFMTLGAPYLGNFQIDLAYPEVWMRATHSITGNPIGAVAVYASSTDLDYASPQAAQYKMVDLLVEETVSSFGGLMYNGTCFSIDLYGERGEKTFKSYHIFGDASLQVRTDTPEKMTPLHASEIPHGATSFEVTVEGVSQALCAISRNNKLLGYGYTDGSGHAVINFEEPITGENPLDLVITAYNKISEHCQVAVLSAACGDANSDETVNVTDAVWIVNYVFAGGDPPDPMESGDCNCDGTCNVADAVWIINYIFAGGYAPCDTDGDGAPDC